MRTLRKRIEKKNEFRDPRENFIKIPTTTESSKFESRIFPYQVEILETCTNALDHVQSFGMAVWARIQGSVKTAAYFFNTTLELFSLEKGDEGSFVYLVALEELSIFHYR